MEKELKIPADSSETLRNQEAPFHPCYCELRDKPGRCRERGIKESEYDYKRIPEERRITV